LLSLSTMPNRDRCNLGRKTLNIVYLPGTP
jgi:hypothetical protein